MVPPVADGPGLLSVMWCHVSPAAGKVRGRNAGAAPLRAAQATPILTALECWWLIRYRDRLTAVSPEPPAPAGSIVHVRTGNRGAGRCRWQNPGRCARMQEISATARAGKSWCVSACRYRM